MSADAIRSFVTAIEAGVAASRERDKALAALARVTALLDGMEAEGQGYVTLSSVRGAMDGTT